MSTSRILQRLYSLDSSSPDFLRHLFCLIQYDEEERYLTSLQGSGLARLVNFLDGVLSAIPTTDEVQRQCLQKLQTICGHHTAIPSSCVVSDQIARVGDGPITLGGIADVWEGTCHGKKVFIKHLRVSVKNYQTIKKSFFQGAVLWRNLRHPNIVPFIGVTTNPLQIISEWMPNGTLPEFIEENPGVNRVGLLLDVAEGLDYLHANHTVHGNLTGSSVLVDHDGHARLTDFEFASIVRGRSSGMQGYGYTVARAVPEILGGEDLITPEADVFTFGMVVIEVFTGKHPLGEPTAPVITPTDEWQARPQVVPKLGLTDSLWDMTVRCWRQDPTQRPKMMEVVELLDELLASSLSIEADLDNFFHTRQALGKDEQVQKAQQFADRFDNALDNVEFHRRKHGKYLRHLQKLCSTFRILPSSFRLPPAAVEKEPVPFASGGYSVVYGAMFEDRPVVIKIFSTTTRMDRERLHRVLVKEVIGWKWLRHENILPFVGVMLAPSPMASMAIASERMENGNIMDFVQARHDYNRLRLLVDAATGLEYLHERNIVHGDLKGVNILIDSECRARLADFGLAVVVSESTTRSSTTGGGSGGTFRWMAPELLNPEKFGFTGGLEKKLPSKDTDIYAIGMTILEVLTGCVPFANVPRNETVIAKVTVGDRPDRPTSGFSDALWGLLVTTWTVQYAREPRGRPPVSTTLDQLKGFVDHWGESIVPLVPEFWKDTGDEIAATQGTTDFPTCTMNTTVQSSVFSSGYGLG